MNLNNKTMAEIKQLVESGEIDLYSLSKEDLQAIFDKEMEVQYENRTYDMTLLNKIGEVLGKDDDEEFSEFWNREYTSEDFKKLAERNLSIIKNQGREDTVKKNKLHMIKRISVVAACFILVIGGLTFTAYATVPSFKTMILNILNLPIGSSIEDSGITYVNNGETKQYSTINELIEAENLRDYDIVFPDDLPTELRIKSIYVVDSADHLSLDISFTDDSSSMGIDVGSSIDITSSAEKMEINGFTVYIDEYNGIFSSMMSYESNVYYITSAKKESIINILEHMNKE